MGASVQNRLTKTIHDRLVAVGKGTDSNPVVAGTINTLLGLAQSATTVMIPNALGVQLQRISTGAGRFRHKAMTHPWLFQLEGIKIGSKQLYGILVTNSNYYDPGLQQYFETMKLALPLEINLDNNARLFRAIGIYKSENVNTYWRTDDNIFAFGIKEATPDPLRKLALACTAFVNCNNILLQRQEVEEAVNRKRTTKGKQIIRPYYCPIMSDMTALQPLGMLKRDGEIQLWQVD
jgi:hypothetical protein